MLGKGGQKGPVTLLQELLTLNPNGLTKDQTSYALGLANEAAAEFTNAGLNCDQAVAAAKSSGISVPMALGLSLGSAVIGGLVERAIDHAFPRKR